MDDWITWIIFLMIGFIIGSPLFAIAFFWAMSKNALASALAWLPAFAALLFYVAEQRRVADFDAQGQLGAVILFFGAVIPCTVGAIAGWLARAKTRRAIAEEV